MARHDEVFSRQVFRVHAPAAQKVLLLGDFTEWREHPIAMEKGDDGVWTASVGLSPGTYSYMFLVDGEWQDDPDCETRAVNPQGLMSMVRRVIYSA